MAYNRIMIDRKCLLCGTYFRTYLSRIASGRGKYCGKSCSDLATHYTKGHIPANKGKSYRVHSDPNKVRPTRKNYGQGFKYAKSRHGGSSYRLVHIPEHPYSTKAGYVREHRLVMEKIIGRYLLPSEVVHHVDSNTLNNDPSNLVLMTKVDHDRMNTSLNIHRRWRNKGGDAPCPLSI